jgi:hypothetical protein
VVTHPRAQNRTGRIRPLNRPRPLRVEAGEDACPEPGVSRSRRSRPIAVYLASQRYAVESVLETWRIDDEWWRERAVSRLYFSLLLEDGRTVTVYRDLVSGRWAQQGY